MNDTMIQIRKCTPEDLDMLAALRIEFLKEANHVKDGDDTAGLFDHLRRTMEGRLNRDLHMWFAVAGGRPVATGALCIWEGLPLHEGEQNKIGYVLNIYTHPKFRRQGIAGRVVTEILSFMKKEGIQKAMLHALDAGKGVYKSLGFGVNESLMELKL